MTDSFLQNLVSAVSRPSVLAGLAIGGIAFLTAVFIWPEFRALFWSAWAAPLAFFAFFGTAAGGYEFFAWTERVSRRPRKRRSEKSRAARHKKQVLENLKSLAGEDLRHLQECVAGKEYPPRFPAGDRQYINQRLYELGILTDTYSWRISDVAWNHICADPSIVTMKWQARYRGDGRYLVRA